MTIDQGGEPLEICMPEEAWEIFNVMIEESGGEHFIGVARQDPRRAYDLLRSFLKVCATRAEAAELGGIGVSSTMDGDQATQGVARRTIEDTFVDADTEPVDVVISIFRKKFIGLTEFVTEHDFEAVASFTVEPINRKA